jgi:hypothetical protein
LLVSSFLLSGSGKSLRKALWLVKRFEWIELDGLPVRPPTRKGFGSRLLEHVLPRQIGADVTVDYDPDGLRARIVVPLPH